MLKFLKKISMALVFIMCIGVMTSCFGGSSNKKVSMTTDELYKKATEKIELPSLEKVSSSELEGLMGISSSDVEDASVYISMINVIASEIGIFKFSSPEQEKAIDKGIEQRLADLEATWSRYLPEQYELVKNVKKFTFGNVKGYVIADDASKIVSNLENATK